MVTCSYAVFSPETYSVASSRNHHRLGCKAVIEWILDHSSTISIPADRIIDFRISILKVMKWNCQIWEKLILNSCSENNVIHLKLLQFHLFPSSSFNWKLIFISTQGNVLIRTLTLWASRTRDFSLPYLQLCDLSISFNSYTYLICH